MNKILTTIILLVGSLALYAQGGYDPDVPPNPDAPKQKYTLSCEVVPAYSGSTNVTKDKFEADRKITLYAYNYSNYEFVCWMNDNDTIAKDASFTFTMPAKETHLKAVFTYNPGTPANPDTPTTDPGKGDDDPKPDDKPGYDPTVPSNPGSNTFDALTGIVIANDFTAGSLRSAINKAISGYAATDVRQIIVMGTVNDNDVSAANDYSNCTSIDFSRCPAMTAVPSYAYYGNSSLEQIVLPASLETIRSNAFVNASKLTSITCYATVPPKASGNAFTGLPAGATAYVPEKSIEAYKAAEGWNSLFIQAAKNQHAVDFTVSDVAFGTSNSAPQQEITLSWTVNNEGSSDSNAGWKETIYLTNNDETSPILYTLYYNSTLAAGGNVKRTATFTLPNILGVSGDVYARVVIMPASNAGESVQAQANNVGISAQTAVIAKRLYISSASSVLKEGTSGIAVNLKRSGSCKEVETVDLTVKPENLTNIPNTASFSVGENTARFIVTVPDNADVNAIDSIYVTASGNSYEPVTLPVAFEDNDKYPLSIKLDRSTYAEGDTIHAVISVGTAVGKDLPITLNMEHAKRFRLPTAIVIKAGESAVKVDIPVINDDIPSNDEGIEVKASAEGYDVATAMFILTDDDVPAIEMTLTPSTVSEGAGAEAIHAVITRREVIDNKITLRLTDDGNGDIFYYNTITMEKGVTQVTIPIGVVDNAKVDGARDINLTASIFISTCNCNAVGTKQSVVTKTITILDNDGPTLTLKADKTVIIEGDTNGTTITLSRNTSADKELPVKLEADADGIVLPAQVTIPPGKESTTFTLYAKSNKVQEGNRVVNVKALCDGYTMGAAYVLVTDQTLPDMSLEGIALSAGTVEVNQKYIAKITVKNVGAIELPERSTVQIKTDNEEFSLTIPEALAVGAEKVLTAELTAPSIATTCKVTATCNANNAFAELQTINNSKSASIDVLSPYTMSISADKDAYNMGDMVHLTGKVSSLTQSVARIKVEPYVMYLGMRTPLEAMTGEDGSFAVDYTLPKGVGGDFGFGACLPGEETEASCSSVSVYGMARASSSYYKLRLYKDEPYKISVPISNLSSIPLTGIVATVEDATGIYDVKASGMTKIDGNSQGMLDLKITASALSESKSWERVMINLTSAEGANLTFPIYCYCVSHGAVLELSTRNITTTITKDTSRVFPVVLTNSGMGNTGKITVDCPAGQKFVSLASSPTIQPLAMGDSATVLLKFNPEGLDVNVTQNGSIAINCENSDGISLAYSLKVVSEAKGNLAVRVMDENTEYGNANGEHPYVANATVAVKDYTSGVTLFTGTTDTDGYARFEDINEGAYTVYVTAAKHDSYTQNVMVNPGETTDHLAYVSYQAISVSFSVEETTVEDVYNITSSFVYETQVPVPVVVMDGPEEIELQKVVDGGSLLYNVTLTNKGLINANDVCLSLPQAEGIDFIALNECTGLTLAPGQAWTVPVYVCQAGSSYAKKSRGRKSITRSMNPLKCSSETYLGWSYPCSGNDKATQIAEVVKFLLRTCDPDEPDQDKKVTKPKEDPITEIKDTVDHGEPQIRYSSIKSQVDLYGMYQYACKLFCSMQCLPINQKQYAALAKDPTSTLKCIWKNATKNYARSVFAKNAPLDANQSLFETYEVKLNLIFAIDSLSNALDAEVVNAPELRADTATYSKVKPALSAINENISAHHSAGVLYTKTADQLYDENILLMPQRMADWYDLSLPTYIERQVNTFRRADGLEATNDNYIDANITDRLRMQLDSCYSVMKQMGFVDLNDLIMSTAEDSKALAEASGNTCASVKFQISQQMVLTRQAFRGTMVIENSSNSRLTNITTAITATNEQGVQATAHEMQISLESTSGFMDNGDGTWTLEPGAVGIATYLFIPTKYAAPDKAQTYSFGGNLYFNDGDNDQARSLYPCSLLVKPTPELDLTYFMQRDLYGDNPLTEDVIEPVIPAEFTVLIHNKGMGDAQNVRMITHQPEIVDNEKGLMVDFKIVASSLNGQNKTMALADDIATDFGTIAAGKCAYATWDLTSSLLGHIKDYNIGYTHLTSYDNPDLSLLDNVTIHELIHSINVRLGGQTYRAWVTNDVADTYDLPDHIYFSDGTDDYVNPLPGAAKIEVVSETECKVTVNAVTKEWFYTNVENPMDSAFMIKAIVNTSSDEELDPESFWTTTYTMVDGKDPVKDPRLHIVDMTTGTGEVTYAITYESIGSVDNIKDVKASHVAEDTGIYTLAGIMVSPTADRAVLRNLPDGIYIVNKRKFVKR